MLANAQWRLAAKLAVAAAVAAAAVFVLPDGSLQDTAENETITRRIALMRANYRSWKLLKTYGKDERVTNEDVATYARQFHDMANTIPTLFPAGTGRGDYPDKVTRALPVIWTDRSGFERASQSLAEESAALENAAKSGDREAIVKQIGRIVKVGCIDCHNAYRGGKAK